jgi:penicillin-binding protein 1C
MALWKTWAALLPFPASLTPEAMQVQAVQIVDRHGVPLSVTFQNPWNVHQVTPLHAIPPFLQLAFIQAEDKRFYQHGGVDWWARCHALTQNVLARRVVRGASTITEQAVRMLHPRPRTLWSRWLEGVEAIQLEARFPKATILEFYLNQVPYARQRRGVVQAARMYFDRDLSTLSQHEMLALAVLVRAPSRLDLRRDPTRIRTSLRQFAARLYDARLLTADALHHLLTQDVALQAPVLSVQASHFLRYVRRLHGSSALPRAGQMQTTLDATLQQQAQALLDSRLWDLQARGVTDGALLVVDHQSSDVLAWVNAGGSQIDTVRTPRQPGSTLKPFLYALAVEQGWTAATLIADTSLEQPVGVGLHAYRNYSGRHYGPLRLREALGNSLNVPAIRTIAFVGASAFLERLQQLGFRSLRHSAAYYGSGLALGNGEVSLFELVQAYATLACHGVFQPLRVLQHAARQPEAGSEPVYSSAVSSLIANILADPEARRREFGAGNLLHFPVETAVKTGTSSDYRDAWAVGFSHRYTVGVWMGNLSQRPMHDVTGSLGPALVLRALFAELHRDTTTHPLLLSPQLHPEQICRRSGQRATPHCHSIREWFLPGTAPAHDCPLHQPAVRQQPGIGTAYRNSCARVAQGLPQSPGSEATCASDIGRTKRTSRMPPTPRLLRPTPGLQLAMDPRIPDLHEVFPLAISTTIPVQRIDWFVDGQLVGTTGRHEYRYLWPLTRGTHTVQAQVWQEAQPAATMTPAVEFIVK